MEPETVRAELVLDPGLLREEPDFEPEPLPWVPEAGVFDDGRLASRALLTYTFFLPVRPSAAGFLPVSFTGSGAPPDPGFLVCAMMNLRS